MSQNEAQVMEQPGSGGKTQVKRHFPKQTAVCNASLCLCGEELMQAGGKSVLCLGCRLQADKPLPLWG